MTSNNINNVQRWMHLEEPNTQASLARSNPLNVGGAASYPSLDAGLIATAKVIQQSNMSGIYNALKASAPWPVFSQALVNSPWDAAHYGGSASAITNTPTQQGHGQANLASNPPTSTLGQIGQIGQVLTDLTSATLWKNVGLIIGGGLMVILGGIVFLYSTKGEEE